LRGLANPIFKEKLWQVVPSMFIDYYIRRTCSNTPSSVSGYLGQLRSSQWLLVTTKTQEECALAAVVAMKPGEHTPSRKSYPSYPRKAPFRRVLLKDNHFLDIFFEKGLKLNSSGRAP
jgi:hypothetical protein